MAQGSYTTDLTTLTQNETNTGVAEPTAVGWTSLNVAASAETDYFIQNVACTSATVKVGVGGLMYNNGSGFTIPTDGAVLCWAYFWAPGVLAAEASGGARQMIGSSLADFYYVNHLGSDSWLYGGWQCLAMADPGAITTDTQVGTPTATRQYTGWAYNAPTAVPGKGNPYGIDAIRYGRGTLQITNGDGTEYGTFAAAAEFNDKNSTAARTGFTLLDSGYHRLGLFQYQDGAYKWQGHFLMGIAATAVDFRDSNRLIFVLNTKHVTANFNLFEVRNAGSNVVWTGITIVALGTVSKGRFLATDDATITLTTCTFTDMDTFVFKSLSTITGTTFRRCGQITTGGATFTGCTIDSSTASSAVLAASPANAALISNTSFTSDGTGYGIEIGGTSANMTLTDVTFTNYDSDISAVHTGGTITGNEAIYINIASGIMELDISGGTTPSVASAGATVTITKYKTITITVKNESGGSVESARVAVYKTSDMTELMNTTTNASGVATAQYNYVSDTAVTIRVRKSSATPKYIATETSGTITTNGLTTTITFVAEAIAESTTDANINGDFTVDTTTKTIRHVLGETPIYTVKKFYTWLMDYFDESGLMDDTIPMTAQTPSEYTLINGWFLDDTSTQFLKEGAIQTSGWTHPTNTTGIRILTLASITGVDASDLGTAVAGVTTGDTGKLVDYNTTLKKLWVRTDATDDDFNNTSENINVNGSLAGAMGGAVAVTGETIWSNIFTLGTLVSGTTVDTYQNDTQITPFWSSGHIDILVKVKEASVETDSGNLTVLARKYGTLFDHYVIDASTGRNPVPLAAFTDGNNATAEGTVSGYNDITITFGATSQDIGNGARPYDVIVDCVNNRTVAQAYEYLKYVTEHDSAATLNGASGEFYEAVGDIRFTYTTVSGTISEGSAITDTTSGATGYITSRIASSNTLVVTRTHGTFSNTDSISSGGATGTIDSVPDSISPSKQAPFGTFAGGRFFGARGVFIQNMLDPNNYQLIDSTNTADSPPVSATVIITVKDTATPPVAIASARVLVAADAGGPMPYDVTVTISNSGTTATVTHTGHGMATNDKVVISGASLIQNLGVFTITLDGADPTNKYTYTMASAPGSSPTGTIKSTFVVLEGLTNASGIITMSRVFPSDQPVIGRARKSTSAPYYKEGAISGTVDSSSGFSATLLLVSDE